MANNYDNWERLVGAVLRREQLRRIALNHSRNPSSITSRSSSFNLSSSSSSQINESFAYNEQRLQLFAANWERFLTPEDQEIISTTVYLSFFLDERSGKKCYMVGARELKISWGDTPQYWKWTSHADSRFPEVAELQFVWWLDIRGKIKTRMLSPKTIYAAFLVFKLAEGSRGLEVANAMIRSVDDESDKDAEKQGHIVHLHQTLEYINEHIAVSRADGWMEVEMGKFYVDEGDEGEVEARLLETRYWKTGLIVEGIEFRPTCTLTSFISKKKQVGERNRKGRRVFFKLKLFR
ncbi:hypothetical protein Pfo_026612 [Paulownia fortunei]|nr:hypothetical protein Pfo_026612 [Paulownia fortunei]